MYADAAFLLGKQASGNPYGGVELQSKAVNRWTDVGGRAAPLSQEGPAGNAAP
jgi:hypothetical protein